MSGKESMTVYAQTVSEVENEQPARKAKSHQPGIRIKVLVISLLSAAIILGRLS